MKTHIDSETGTLGLKPESESDRLLIYHLMNCADLNHFSQYIECTGDTVTEDLGVSVEQIDNYPLRPVSRSARQPVNLFTEISTHVLRPRMIGFSRNSS